MHGFLSRLSSRFKVVCGVMRRRPRTAQCAGAFLLGAGFFSIGRQSPKELDSTKANNPPQIEELADLAFAPNVSAPIDRDHPIKLNVCFDVEVKELPIDDTNSYEFWTFNGGMPGPFFRARQGDIVEVTLTNNDPTGMLHNLDFHSVTGPGGGASYLTTDSGRTTKAQFRMEYPGVFFYHCAVAPVPVHVANGMYGLMVVEPKQGLKKVDKEFYILQNELYTTESEPGSRLHVLDEERLMDENPNYVVLNGRDGSLRGDNALLAKAGDRVRIFFGNAGPNLIASFHIIGAIFDEVYREGDLISPPARGIQTTLVPSGGATMVEFDVPVPGTYAIVDHSVSRFEKGVIGWLKVEGEERPDIIHSDAPPRNCPRCKHHP